MFNSFSSNVITTKTKSMYGKRITLNDYKEMIRKNNITEIASYLKHQTKYSTALMSVQETNVGRGQLEHMLNRDMFHRYLKLVHYDVSKKDSFYSYIIINLDIQQILSTIRIINSGQTERIIQTLPAFVRSYTKVNFMKLADVKSIEDLVSVLRGTPYSEILEKIHSKDDDSIDITACEVALRTYYFKEIESLINKNYKGKTNKDLKTIFETQLEIYNVTTIYRLKLFYQLSSSEIVKYLVPTYKDFPGIKLFDLVNTNSAEEFLKMLSKSRYGKFFENMDYSFVEYTTEKIKYCLNKRYMSFSNDAPICFAAYMVLCEIEIDNLTTIVEGVRYNIPSEQIEKLLVLY